MHAVSSVFFSHQRLHSTPFTCNDIFFINQSTVSLIPVLHYFLIQPVAAAPTAPPGDKMDMVAGYGNMGAPLAPPPYAPMQEQPQRSEVPK